jgi:hypothetical protein
MSKNVVEPERRQMTTWRMRVACWICNTTHMATPPPPPREICSTAFPRQQWFPERASVLRYMHIACLVSDAIKGTSSMYAAEKRNTEHVSLQAYDVRALPNIIRDCQIVPRQCAQANIFHRRLSGIRVTWQPCEIWRSHGRVSEHVTWRDALSMDEQSPKFQSLSAFISTVNQYKKSDLYFILKTNAPRCSGNYPSINTQRHIPKDVDLQWTPCICTISHYPVRCTPYHCTIRTLLHYS